MARKKGRRNKPFKVSIKKDTMNSILAVIVMLVGGLIAVSFSQQGAFLTAIFEFLSSMLGWPMIFLPFIFIAGGLMLTSAKIAIASPHVLLGALVTMVSLSGLTRSGNLGEQIFSSFATLFSSAGSVLFYVVGTIIGLFILFETSIEDIIVFLQEAGEKLGQTSARFKGISTMKDGGLSNLKPKFPNIKITGGSDDDDAPAAPKESPTREEVVHPKSDSVHAPAPMGSDIVWKYPPINLLSSDKQGKADRGDVNQNVKIIQDTLGSFGIQSQVTEVNKGPAVTQYAIDIAQGTKLSKIVALQSDLALALSAPQGQIRIEAPIPGRNLVGIEIPNRSLEFVTLRELLASKPMQEGRSRTLVGLGLDVSGSPVIADLAKMPHILVAGTTGSGKSVLINSIISSILFRAAPEEVKLILVDPKRVELTPYNGIPHLICPVITDVEKVVAALGWLVKEMEHRYKILQEVGVRNIASYNEQAGFPAMSYIIVIIDEMADIMMSKNANDVEQHIVRIAQMARAVGIHLVLATQRPSVNVLTGLIKANVPARIAFQVASMIDSRVIIDGPGAEKLLGKGDMLYIPPDMAKPSRIQGAYVSDKEISGLIQFIRNSGIEPAYNEEVTKNARAESTTSSSGADLGDVDDKFEEAARFIISTRKASSSVLQRKLQLGYARAARIMDQMEQMGIIGASDGNKPREVLVNSFEEALSKATGAPPPDSDTE